MGNGFDLSLKKAIRAGLIPGRYRVDLANRPFNVAAVTSGPGVGTIVVDDLPLKQLFIRGIRAQLTFTKQDANVIATWSGIWSLGSAPAAIDATLTATEADIIPSTAVGPAVLGALTSTPSVITTEIVRNWLAADELNLNLIVNAADITDSQTAGFKVNGYIDFLLGQI